MKQLSLHKNPKHQELWGHYVVLNYVNYVKVELKFASWLTTHTQNINTSLEVCDSDGN